jgi:hypothetical protein
MVHNFNRTLNFNLSLIYICFVQQCINDDKTTNVPTQSWSGKSAVFLMKSALTSHGSSKSKKSRRTAEESRTKCSWNGSPFDFNFRTFVTWLRENYDYCNVSWQMICIYDLTLSKMRGGNVTHAPFFYSFITILPSESGVALEYSTIFT